MKFFIYIIPIILSINLMYSQCEGDANLDDNTNIQDIVLIINHIVYPENGMLFDDGFNNSDVNNDQILDVIDVVSIINMILSSEYNCEDPYMDLSQDWDIQEDLSYFDSEELENILDNEISQLSYLRGIIVIHEGEVVGEEYYNSSVDDTYNIWSVTKSFISTLIGQAIDQNLIDDTSSTLDNFFPDYSQPYLEFVTLDNLLSMSSGYVDGFGYPYWVNATTQQLEWMGYSSPGYFFYNNSACHLNAHILYYGTGMTPKEFASINLFPYLGIDDPNWLYGFNGINDGSASLELRLRDMVKLGQLYLQDGYSGDTQILSLDWIQEATSFKVSTFWPTIPGYGYLWWLPGDGYLAIGYGGQYIAVIPELNLVIGTRSIENNDTFYQQELLDYIYNSIAPLFENN